MKFAFVMTCAGALLGGIGLRDKDPDTGGGGAALSEAEFQERTLGGIKKVTGTVDDLLSKYDNLDKETKKAMEELTKVKNSFTGLDSQTTELNLAIKKLNLRLALEQRAAYGSPGQQLMADPETAKTMFVDVCRAVGRQDLASKALGENTSPGSTLINSELSTQVYDSLLRYGSWATLGVRNVGTKQQNIPVKTVRPVANFILTEGGTVSDDTNKAGVQKSLNMQMIAVLLNVSKQLLDDAEIDITADVMDDMMQALNYRIDFAAFQGSGATDATNGIITGLFPFATAAVAATGHTSVAATTVDDWIKCLLTVDAAVLSRSARWWMHPTLVAAAMGVKDLNGRPIFQTALEAPGAGIFNILGSPVSLVGAAPNTNTINSKVAVYGDPQAFAVGVRKQFELEYSPHFKWDSLQESFRGNTRMGAVGLQSSALACMTLPAS